MRKKFSPIIAITTMISLSLNNLSFIPTVNAASFRTTYKIYGDLNGDKKIDIYDVISMRKEVVKGTYNKYLDFNCDNAVDSTDLSLLNGYVLGENTFFDAYLCDDADEDSVCDILEIAILESDPDSKDTDGDTLSDFDEVVYTNTSPTNKNTRGLSVTDAEDDADGDKLTNKEEIANKTNPQADDSDMDGINDYDELKKYNTDPNNEDSDNDGITDGDEIKLGLKPDSDKSDGQTPDNQRTFENKISASNELLSHINTEDTPYEVSIDIKSAGNIEKALSIQTGSFSNTSEDDHFIGKSLAISYADNLTVETAKIYFKPDTIEGNIENYMIFEFFPETNYLLPVETKYISDAAYVETNELGTFTLVKTKDSKSSNSLKMASYNAMAAENSEKTIGNNDIVYDYELGALEVAFFVDISEALTDNLEETKNSIHDCCQAIFEHSNNAYIEIIGCYSPPDYSKSNFFAYNNSNSDALHTNIISVDEALSNIKPISNYNKNSLTNIIWNIDVYKNKLFTRDDSQKYAFIINNSDYSFTAASQYKMAIATEVRNSLKEIYNSNIHLNFLLSKKIFTNKTAVNNLKDACKPYNFGVYSNLETGYFGNTGFARIYSDAITDIKKTTVYHITALDPQIIPAEVNRNAFLNSLPSSYDKSKVPAADANGNINFKDAAVKIGAAYYDEYGNIVFPSMLDACSYNELTKNGYEQYMKNCSTSERLISGSIQITPFSDKLLYIDTDNDGIPDAKDANPYEKFDERFVTTEGFVKNSTNNNIDNKEKIAKDLYSSAPLWDKIFFRDTYQAYYFGALGNVAGGKLAMDMPNAASFIKHFLDNSGEDYLYDAETVIKGTQSGKNNYIQNINDVTKLCESTVIDELWFISKPSIQLPGTDFSTTGCIGETDIAIDWWFSIGDADASMTIHCTKIGNTYYATITYHLLDYYDWQKGSILRGGLVSDGEMYDLHVAGMAKEFKSIGTYTKNISWKKGETINETSLW